MINRATQPALGTSALLTGLCACVLAPTAVLLVLTPQLFAQLWSPLQEGLLNGYLLLLMVAALIRTRFVTQTRTLMARLGASFLVTGAVLTFLRLAGPLAEGALFESELTAKSLGALLLVLSLGSFGRRIDQALDADSQATMRSTFNSIAEPLIVLERDCTIREINWYGELRFPGSLPGARVCDTAVLRRDSCEHCPVGTCFEENQPQCFAADASGSERGLDFTAIPVSVQGTPAERQVLRLKLSRGDSVNQERLDFLGDVVAAVPEAVVGLDRTQCVIAVNPQGEVLLGVSQQEALGRPVGELFRFAESADRQRFERFLARDEKAELELTLKSGEGHAVRAVIGADPLHATDGTRTGTALIVRDVTESRRFEEMLRQSEKMSSLGLFVSGLAHELNNPVTAIFGAARTLKHAARDGLLGEGEHLEAVSEVLRHAEQCGRVVGSLLRLARNERSGMRSIKLTDVVADTVELLGRSLDRERIRLEVRCEPDLPDVRGDGAQLQQVLMNLIANARDSIRELQGGGTIRIAMHAEGRCCRIDVEDDGKGFEPGRQELFRAFSTTKADGQGTGLGLFISRAIVREHGGTLEARERQPHGAVLRISLPALIESEPPLAGPDAAGVPEAARDRLNLLVVDDEPSIGRYLGACLESLGHQVTVLEDPLEARTLISNGTSYDLIFSDCCMPRLSGSELYRQVVHLRPAYRGQFVFVTGDVIAASDLPLTEGNGLLQKPFSPEQLEAALNFACA